MNASPFFASAVALALLLAAAVASHLQSRRIADALVLAGVAVALLLHGAAFITNNPALAGAWWSAPLGLYAGLMVLVPLYLLRLCRGDAVKLMAMVGAFIGPVPVLWAGLYATLAAGLLWLGLVAFHALRSQASVSVRHVATERGESSCAQLLAPVPARRPTLQPPCAVAIAAGTLLAMRTTLGGFL